MNVLAVSALIGVCLGIIAALVLYALLVWPVKRRSDRVQHRTTKQNGFPEEVLDQIADNAKSIRTNSEDVLMRVSRLRNLQHSRERRSETNNEEEST